jgi:hypothetical protein
MAHREDFTFNMELSPRIITIKAPSTEATVQEIHDTLTTYEDSLEGLAYPRLITSSGKEDLGGGVRVGISSTLQNARIAFEARKTFLASGSVTTEDTNGTILTDSLATFITNGITPGSWIVNMTDQSICSVIQVISETTILTDGLGGGTDNQWNISDNYKILEIIQGEIAGGNLVAIDENEGVLDAVLPTAGTQIVRTSSASATLQELSAIQYSSFNGGVSINTDSSYSGTEFPIGTPEQPVNNISDALAIANERGFGAFYILSDLTLTGSLDLSKKHFHGTSKSVVLITIDSSVNLSQTGFHDCTITGTLDGESRIEGCKILDLNYVDGFVEDSILEGTITLSGTGPGHILNCFSGHPGEATPTINMGGSGSSLVLRNYNGGIKLTNKSGSEEVSVDLNSGQVIVDSTVTNGLILVRGIGNLTDNSTGTAVVNSSSLLNVSQVSLAVWDEDVSKHIISGTAGEVLRTNSFQLGRVYVDSIDGVPGTAHPIGTPVTPVNNMSDAKTIANAIGTNAYVIRGNITLSGSFDHSTFIGSSIEDDLLDLNGQSVTSCTFLSLKVSGTQVGTQCLYKGCTLNNLSGVTGTILDSFIINSVTIGGPGSIVIMHNVAAGGSFTGATIDLAGSNRLIAGTGLGGDWTLKNATTGFPPGIARMGFDSGTLTIDSTCIGGIITLDGVCNVTDNSGSAILTDNTLNKDSFTLFESEPS